MMPTSAGATPYAFAFARIVRIARWASMSGTYGRPLCSRYSKHHPGDAVFVKPRRDPVRLGTGHEPTESAARADDANRAIGLVRQLDGDDRVCLLERAVALRATPVLEL